MGKGLVDMDQTENVVGDTSPVVALPHLPLSEADRATIRARRTAFVARFIVLREGKRSRAHRVIEMMTWPDAMSAEDLCDVFRRAFLENGDNMTPVDRDLRRALAHSSRSLNHFIAEYATRATTSFIESLFDYERSNTLLFGDDDSPKPGGWRLPHELSKLRAMLQAESNKRQP